MELNPLERRAKLLADKLEDRITKVSRALTQPSPYGQQKVPEGEQVRKFVALRDSGQLPALREHFGDQEVDRYVRSMQPRLFKYLGLLAEGKVQDAKTEEAGPAYTNREPGTPVASFYTADDDLDTY